jgi:hypothetical protein
VAVHPLDRGRQIVRLDFNLKHPFPSFYNEEFYGYYHNRAVDMGLKASELEAKAKTVPPGKDRELIERDIAWLHDQSELESSRLAKDPAQAIPFHFETRFVDRDWATPENELSEMLKSYKAVVHDAALEQ